MPKDYNNFSLEILKSVDDFYSHSFDKLSDFYIKSFDQLIFYIGWGGAAVVVIIPIINAIYQKRLSKIESREIKSSIDEKMEERIKALEEMFDKKLDEEKKKNSDFQKVCEEKLELKIKNLESKLKKENYNLKAKIESLQADTVSDFGYKLFWRCQSAISYLKSEDHKGLNIQIELIIKAMQTPEDKPESIMNAVKDLIKILENYDNTNNGVYWGIIYDLKRKFGIQ